MLTSNGIDFQYKPIPVIWNSRDAILYAISIGVKGDDLQFLYEGHPNFQVFAGYPSVLSAKGEGHDLVPFFEKEKLGIAESIQGGPPLDMKRMVDGGRAIEFFKPLPVSSAGCKFELQGKLIGVYDKGKSGTVVATATDLVDTATKVVYARITGRYFYIGQGGWGGPKGPATVSWPPPQRKPDAIYEILTTDTTAAVYRLNGDTNPLHIVPEMGISMGFGGPIIHGLFLWNAACYALLRHWGGSQSVNMKQFEAVFSAPVVPGNTIGVQSWTTGRFDADGFQEIRFIAEIVGGKTCLRNGRTFIKAPNSKM